MERLVASELIEGPVQQWEPSAADKLTIKKLLESDDELDNAYGEAYMQRCFVREFGMPNTGVLEVDNDGPDDNEPGMTAVGELDALAEMEFRLGVELGPDDLSLGDCMGMTYPGRGSTRVERIRDGVRQIVERRKEIADAENPIEPTYEYSSTHYVHYRYKDAIEMAESNGLTARVTQRDNLYLGVEDGIDPNRVNFSVRNGIVTAARLG